MCVHVHLHIQFSSESWQILAFGDLPQQQAPQVSWGENVCSLVSTPNFQAAGEI